jgi:hypothetical protein
MGVPDLSNATFSIDDLGKLNCLLFSFFSEGGILFIREASDKAYMQPSIVNTFQPPVVIAMPTSSNEV